MENIRTVCFLETGHISPILRPCTVGSHPQTLPPETLSGAFKALMAGSPGMEMAGGRPDNYSIKHTEMQKQQNVRAKQKR